MEQGLRALRFRPSKEASECPYPAVEIFNKFVCAYIYVCLYIDIYTYLDKEAGTTSQNHYQHLADLLREKNTIEWNGMECFEMGLEWGRQAGSNSWTNEPTDRMAGASSQIDARGSSWAPLFVHLLHPLYSLLTPIMSFPHTSPIQDGIYIGLGFLCLCSTAATLFYL